MLSLAISPLLHPAPPAPSLLHPATSCHATPRLTHLPCHPPHIGSSQTAQESPAASSLNGVAGKLGDLLSAGVDLLTRLVVANPLTSTHDLEHIAHAALTTLPTFRESARTGSASMDDVVDPLIPGSPVHAAASDTASDPDGVGSASEAPAATSPSPVSPGLDAGEAPEDFNGLAAAPVRRTSPADVVRTHLLRFLLGLITSDVVAAAAESAQAAAASDGRGRGGGGPGSGATGAPGGGNGSGGGGGGGGGGLFSLFGAKSGAPEPAPVPRGSAPIDGTAVNGSGSGDNGTRATRPKLGPGVAEVVAAALTPEVR